MARMTDDEADALDEYYTKNTIMPDSGKPGFFERHKEMFVGVDLVTAACLRAKADATHKTPSQIIGELVRKEMAYA
jgi:hypothetical protein